MMSPDTHVTIATHAPKRQENEILPDDVARAAYTAALNALKKHGVFPGREKLVTRMRHVLGFFDEPQAGIRYKPSRPKTAQEILRDLEDRAPRTDQPGFMREERYFWSRMAEAVIQTMRHNGYDVVAPSILTPQAIDAARAAVECQFANLTNEQTSLPDWANVNLFGMLFGDVGDVVTLRADTMTLEQFQRALENIVADVQENAEKINRQRNKTSIDVNALASQVQSVADAAWGAASRVMAAPATQSLRITSCERRPER